METAFSSIIILSIALCVSMILITVLYGSKENKYKFIELWTSLLFFTASLFFLMFENLFVLPLILLFWPAKTLTEFISGFTPGVYKPSTFLLPLTLGLLFTLSLMQLDYSFSYYSLPICVTVFGLGLFSLREMFRTIMKRSILQKATFTFIVLFYLLILSFPFLVNANIWFVSTFHFILIGIAACSLPKILSGYYKVYEQELEKELIERDSNLYGKAKYSELGLMSAGIAHEINNPLSIIHAKTEQLLRNGDKMTEEDFVNGLKQIYKASERISQIIKGVRDFIYQDEETYEEEICAQDLIDSVMVFCGQRLKNHGIQFKVEGLDNVFIRGHKFQLEQAMLNLINNAFDAVDILDEKWIKIWADESSNLIELYIEDSGLGIPNEIANRMMEPFYTTKENKGTGLGLAIVKVIVEKHGGEIIYEKNAQNTTFKIVLPKSRLNRPTALPEQFPFIH